MANGRCRMHGGRNPFGVSHPNFRHGKYSKDLVGSLQSRYHEEVTDPKLIELKDEIALSRAYIKDVLRSGESGWRWSDVESAFWALDGALRGSDPGELRIAMDRMHKIVRQGKQDWSHRLEIMRRFEALRRLVDSEHKHRIDNRLAINHEQMAATLAAYVDIVRRHVDVGQLRAINEELGELVREVSDESPWDDDPYETE